MNISSMIFDGVSGTSVVLNTDNAYPVSAFDNEIESRKEEYTKVAAHGLWNARTYLSARRMTIEGAILGNSPADYMAKRMVLLGAFLPMPELGFLKIGTLRLQIDGIPEEIQADCNIDGEPVVPVTVDAPDISEFQIQLIADDPFFYSHNSVVMETGTPTGGSGGLTFPFTFPFTFSGGGGSGDVLVTNIGNTSTLPLVTIYGPCATPSIAIILGTKTYTLSFNDLVLGNTEYMTIDFAKRTVLSSTGGSLYHKVQSGSTWWTIPPGTWTVSYKAQNVASPSRAAISYRSAYLI